MLNHTCPGGSDFQIAYTRQGARSNRPPCKRIDASSGELVDQPTEAEATHSTDPEKGAAQSDHEKQRPVRLLILLETTASAGVGSFACFKRCSSSGG